MARSAETPDELGAVRGGDHHGVARQVVDLHEQEGHNALDLPGLVNVAALLADGVELVEKQHARRRAGVVEHALEARRRFAEEAADQRLVPHDEERRGQGFRDRFRERCLAVYRPSDEQNALPRFERMGTQDRSPVLFLDQLLAGPARDIGQDEIGKRLPRLQLHEKLAVRPLAEG